MAIHRFREPVHGPVQAGAAIRRRGGRRRNGIVYPDEANFANRHNLFDATLLNAAYNCPVVQKDPCGYTRNGMHILQLLNDSPRNLGGDTAVAAFLRP